MSLFGRWDSSRMQSIVFTSGFTAENRLSPEVLFNQILSWEQKRSKRSRRPFILMLLDIQGLTAKGNGSGHAMKDKMAGALCDSTRDIDQRGWYIQDQVMGVIFLELSDKDIVQTKGLVWQRVQSGLCRTFSSQELRQVDVGLHVFPEGCDANSRCVSDEASEAA
jgi:hypothetical protein